MDDIKRRENRVRRKLACQGFSLKKSRKGGYMIVEDWNNTIAAGERFDLSFEDVGRFAVE